MIVKKIFINTYKYDFHFARLCIASVRYWYPDTPVYLIKDAGAGNFKTKTVEKKWGVKIFESPNSKFGWGYGKLEPLFMNGDESFLILDADTVLTGPVIDKVKDIAAEFVVDDEVQPAKRFNEIYYNLNRIHEVDKDFKYPGYSFNTGQWFGTPGVLNRKDFDKSLYWTSPPKTKYPDIIFNNDQTHLNFVLHAKDQLKATKINRTKLMIWPKDNAADFLDLEKIKAKQADFPFVIHWAGMRFNKIKDLPRHDILLFYRQFYYKKMNKAQPLVDTLNFKFLCYQKKVNYYFKRMLKVSSN